MATRFCRSFLARFFTATRTARNSLDCLSAVAERRGFVAQKAGANFITQMTMSDAAHRGRLGRLSDAISSAKETGEVIYACYSLEHRAPRSYGAWGSPRRGLVEFGEGPGVRPANQVPPCGRILQHSSLHPKPSGQAAAQPSSTKRSRSPGCWTVAFLSPSAFTGFCRSRHFLFWDLQDGPRVRGEGQPLLWSAHCHIQFANYCFYISWRWRRFTARLRARNRPRSARNSTANDQPLDRGPKAARQHSATSTSWSKENWPAWMAARNGGHAVIRACRPVGGETASIQDQALR